MIGFTRDDGTPLLSVRLGCIFLLLVSLLALFNQLPAGGSAVDSGVGWLERAGLRQTTGTDAHFQSSAASCAPCPDADLTDCPSTAACVPPPFPQPIADFDQPPIAGACGVNQSIIDTYGRHSIRLSRAHEGSGFRVQRFLAKARRGEKVKVAVLGGSVSLGHGKAGPVTLGRFDLIWHQLVLAHLNATLGSEVVEYIHGAKAGCGSDYFSWCYTAHIPLDVDLVLLEQAVNDGFSEDYFRTSESLLRSVLTLPMEPAVIYVDSFALDNAMGEKASINGADAHTHLALRYDVPQISLRAAGLTALMSDQKLVEPWFAGDKHHITIPQHAMLGDLVIAYLEEQACELDRGGWERERLEFGAGEDGVPGMETLGQIPKNVIEQAWDLDDPLASWHAPPTCQLASAPGSDSELIPTTTLSPEGGWELYDWLGKKFYYQTTTADSPPIRFKVEVREGAKGEVAVSYLRSREYELGRARCRLLGAKSKSAEKGVVLDGYWDAATSLAQTRVIAHGVEPGTHEVECQTLPKREQKEGRVAFRLVSVMSM